MSEKKGIGRRKLRAVLALPLILVILVTGVLFYHNHALVPSLSGAVYLVLLLSGIILFGLPSIQRLVTQWINCQSYNLFVVAFVFWVAFGIYDWGTEGNGLLPLICVGAYLFLPACCCFGYRLWRAEERSGIFLLGAILLVWLPIDLGLLKFAFYFPDGGGTVLLILAGFLYLWVLAESGFGLQGIGLSWRLPSKGYKELVFASLWAGAFIGVFGFWTGFLQWNPDGGSIFIALGVFFALLLGIALPEELLFRGVIQNVLRARFRIKWHGDVICAAIFALSHLNNEGYPGSGFFDGRFVFVALVAGLAYGFIWVRSGSVLLAALSHAGLNTIWFVWLRPG